MNKTFLKKLINQEFEDLSREELEVIINNDHIFALSKKDKTSLNKILEKDDLTSKKTRFLPFCAKGFQPLSPF